MGGGVFSGLIWGTVVSVVILAAVSLSTPLPDRAGETIVPETAAPVNAPQEGLDPQEPQSEPVPAPSAGPDAQGVPDAPGLEAQDPVEPEVQSGPLDDAPAPATTPQESEVDAAAPTVEPTDAETSAASDAVPETPPIAPEAESERAQGTTLDTPAQGTAPRPQTASNDTTPMIRRPSEPGAPVPVSSPQTDTSPAPAPEIARVLTDLPQPGVEIAPPPRFAPATDPTAGAAAPRAITMPQVTRDPPTADMGSAPPPVVEAPSPAPTETTAPDAEDATGPMDPVAAPAPRLPQIVRAPQVEAEAEGNATSETEAPTEAAPRLPQIAGAGPNAPRFPQVGGGALPSVTETPAPVAEAATEATQPQRPNALRDFAADFDTTEDRPLMAIVLIDDPEGGLDPELLTRFTFPVSFAIDPLRRDAAARAAELRAAGFEVVLYGAGLPEAATPSDVEVALSRALQAVPQAVALLDSPESRIQADRPVLDTVVAALAETGHGLLAFPRGLNAAEDTALRADVPAVTVFRMLDNQDQRATVITRFLGRAAFAAAQEGRVVVVGRTRPDTVTALFSWALGSRSEAVALAPISAVLTQSLDR